MFCSEHITIIPLLDAVYLQQ